MIGFRILKSGAYCIRPWLKNSDHCGADALRPQTKNTIGNEFGIAEILAEQIQANDIASGITEDGG